MSAYATDMLGPALLSLMAEKDIRRVTIDELAIRAGVGRATYFRNFSSKEELLTAYLVRRWRAYEEEHRLKELAFSNPERALRYFEFCLSLRAENDLMIEQGCAGAILAAFETIVSDADLGREGSYEAAFSPTVSTVCSSHGRTGAGKRPRRNWQPWYRAACWVGLSAKTSAVSLDEFADSDF